MVVHAWDNRSERFGMKTEILEGKSLRIRLDVKITFRLWTDVKPNIHVVLHT